MTGKETRDRLIRGSENINLMRSRIVLILGMLSALVEQELVVNDRHLKAYKSVDCEWEMFFEKRKLHLRCSLYGTTLKKFCAYSTDNTAPNFGQDIQTVYEKGIPFLLESVEKDFPRLPLHWDFLIQASRASK